MKSLQFSGIKMFILDDILRPEEDFSLSKAFVCLSLFLLGRRKKGRRGRETCHEIGMLNIFPGRRFSKPYIVSFYRRI